MSQSGFYIPSLDGIRAFSVLLVFFSHTSFGHIIPGGLGVSIFFFLSGYLITTLMRMEYEQNQTLSFKKFYLRRVYRIFPPLYIVIFATLILELSGILDRQFSLAGLSVQLLQVTNYYVILYGDSSLLTGLGVLWSLAVEEHFYLIFPLIFLFLSQRFSLQRSALVLFALCILVLLWRFVIVQIWGLPENYDSGLTTAYTYYASDARIDLLLYGCIMALACNPVYHQKNNEQCLNKDWQLYMGLALSAAVLLFTLLYRNSEFRETLRYSLQGIAFFPLFYFAIRRHQWFLFKILNWKPIVYLGKLSYTFYLSHYVCVHIVKKYLGDGVLVLNIASFLLTFCFCAFMYHLVETRFADLRKKLHS